MNSGSLNSANGFQNSFSPNVVDFEEEQLDSHRRKHVTIEPEEPSDEYNFEQFDLSPEEITKFQGFSPKIQTLFPDSYFYPISFDDFDDDPDSFSQENYIPYDSP